MMADQFESIEQERFNRAIADRNASQSTTSSTYSAGLNPNEERMFGLTNESIDKGFVKGGKTPEGDKTPTGGLTPEQILAQQEADRTKEQKRQEGQSAFDILLSEFNQYGLGALIEPLRSLVVSGASPAEFSLKLRETEAYKKRFSANADRIAKGLAALSPAEYIGLEDQYQNIMRNYGLPASYYTKDSLGTQTGFNQLLANDVSAVELTDRINTAQSRVLNANPEVMSALKAFYPDITNGDILAYSLDPTKALSNIKNKITAAEIGGAAMTPKDAMGRNILTTSQARAEQLAGYGVDKAQATQGYSAIGGGLQRGSQLASIYGENPYTQTTAEEEIFKLSGQTEAEKQRKKITGLEKATFGGQTGISQGALARDRAGAY